jgi:outer membrane protein TolC
MKWSLFFALLFLGFSGWAQDPLSMIQFLNWVKQEHPKIKEVNQRLLQAQSPMLIAKGNFDPKWNFAMERKKFEGKNYYTLSENQLSIPSRWGFRFKAGYDFTSGTYLNPFDVKPINGQAVLGFDLPLLQGLFFDEYRLMLREAEIHVNIQKIAVQQVINDLLLDAAKSFIDWLVAYQQKEVQNQALILAKIRLSDMVFSFYSGDKPAVDTVEVYVNVLTREASFLDASLDYQLTSREINNYLWRDNQPLNSDLFFPLETTEMNPTVTQNVDFWVQRTLRDHPDLAILRLSGNQYQIERKWALEQFKLILNLQFNALANGRTFQQEMDFRSENFFLENNYKFGLRAQIPIIFRKERGRLQLIDGKLQEWEYKILDKSQFLATKTNQFYSAFAILNNQVTNLKNQSTQLNTLFEAEKIKFDAGESSVFLLNAREQKNLEINMKLIKTTGEWVKSYYALLWASGQLVN